MTREEQDDADGRALAAGIAKIRAERFESWWQRMTQDPLDPGDKHLKSKCEQAYNAGWRQG